MEDARFQRGLEAMRALDAENAARLEEALKEIAPDMYRRIVEFAFGDIHCRPGLSLQSREIATIAALTALGTAAPQLRAHIHGALNVGCSEQEVVEVIMQMALYAGFPAAINGIQAAREVFLERSKQK